MRVAVKIKKQCKNKSNGGTKSKIKLRIKNSIHHRFSCRLSVWFA